MILQLFEELQDSFTTQEKKLSEYIKNNIEETKKLNAYEIAEKTGISQPTIIRFSKKLGYKGFPEMRIALNKDFSSDGIILHQEVSVDDSLFDATKKIITLNNNAIQSILDYFDEDNYKNVIKKLHDAQKIMIFGLGGSGIVAKDFSHKLMKIGKHVFYDSDEQTQIGNLNSFGPGDLFFAISYSGESKDVLRATKIAREQGCTIVSLTRFVPNSLGNYSDINLRISASEETFRVSSITSRIAQLTVVDIIFVNLVKENYGEYSVLIKKSRDLVTDFNF